MKWRWQDVDSLPSDVYAALVEYLSDESGEESVDMDEVLGGE